MKHAIFFLIMLLISCGGGSSPAPQDEPLEPNYSLSWDGNLYQVWPAQGEYRGVVIMHQGHAQFDHEEYSLVGFAEYLSELGFEVYGFEMPPMPHEGPIEQYYQDVLDFIDTIPDGTPIFMMGLSGGGYTTTASTALCPRITYGYSVSGDIPIDLRTQYEIGDWEQQNPPLPYREMYKMASGRLIHVYHPEDECCFSYYDASGSPRWTEETLGTPFVVIGGNDGRHIISDSDIEFIVDDILMRVQ